MILIFDNGFEMSQIIAADILNLDVFCEDCCYCVLCPPSLYSRVYSLYKFNKCLEGGASVIYTTQLQIASTGRSCGLALS